MGRAQLCSFSGPRSKALNGGRVEQLNAGPWRRIGVLCLRRQMRKLTRRSVARVSAKTGRESGKLFWNQRSISRMEKTHEDTLPQYRSLLPKMTARKKGFSPVEAGSRANEKVRRG
jgi:hypothetical protein